MSMIALTLFESRLPVAVRVSSIKAIVAVRRETPNPRHPETSVTQPATVIVLDAPSNDLNYIVVEPFEKVNAKLKKARKTSRMAKRD